MNKEQNREAVIVRTSVVGIVANVFLAAFKAAVGILSSSIAVVLDAVNNVSDALSSVITIIGTKLAGKAPDKKHPYGYGRIEYLTALVIAVIVLYAGLTSLVESVKKIFNPTEPDYSTIALVIIAVAVVVKIALGLFVRDRGKKVNSDSLIASGTDALMDSIISASTLVAAFVFIVFHISLESYLGVIISILIIKSGIEILKDTLSEILGERIEADFSHSIKQTIKNCSPDIQGVFDLDLHNYGPDRLLGSVHVEVPDGWTSDKIDFLSRKIQEEVYAKHGVLISAVGVYSVNTRDEEVILMRNKVHDMAFSHKHVMQIHGFHVDREHKRMSFDVIFSFDCPNSKEEYAALCSEVGMAFPDYKIQINMDYDISD